MAMRRIVQSLGGRTFKYVYASRTIGTHQQGPVQESKDVKSSPHAKKDTYAPPQHRGTPHEDFHNWEQIKDDISQGRPGGQQSQQPWMEKAKETLQHAAQFVKEKTTTTNISQTAENLKEGAKEKLNQAADYVKDKTNLSETTENIKEGAKEKLNQASDFIKDKTGADLGSTATTAKEKFDDLKEGAKDKLAQAQEFVRKQTIDAGKEKYEQYTPEQKKKIMEEAWDFSKFSKGTEASSKEKYTVFGEKTGEKRTGADKFDSPADFAKTQNEPHHSRSGVENPAAFFGDDQSIASHPKSEQKFYEEKVGERGMFDSVKEKAANAAEWVKDKFTPSGTERQNLNATTDEKVQSASDKLKSDLKKNEDEILKSGP